MRIDGRMRARRLLDPSEVAATWLPTNRHSTANPSFWFRQITRQDLERHLHGLLRKQLAKGAEGCSNRQRSRRIDSSHRTSVAAVKSEALHTEPFFECVTTWLDSAFLRDGIIGCREDTVGCTLRTHTGLRDELGELEKDLAEPANGGVGRAQVRVRRLRAHLDDRRRDWLYDAFEEPARRIKIVLQMAIGIWAVWLISLLVLDTVHDKWPRNLPFEDATLTVIGQGLAVAAAIELAYALFTDGPDEAVDPLILGTAAALAIHLGKSTDNTKSGYIWLTFVLTVCLGLLFVIRARFVDEPALSRRERCRLAWQKVGEKLNSERSQAGLPEPLPLSPRGSGGDDLLRVPTTEDRDRLDRIWSEIAAPGNYNFSPQNRMDLWVIEQRMHADRVISAKLTRATWVLVFATCALFLATVALVVITALSGP